jgi:hypothetical protein
MVVRLPVGPRTAEALTKERLWLPRLAPHLPLAVPRPLADGMPGEGYPFEWSVYSWLHGVDATYERVVDESELAVELARFLAALQRIDADDGPAPGEHNVFRGEPLGRRDASTRSAIAQLRDSIDVDAVTSAWEAALRAPAWDGAPVWVHGDLDRRNLLLEGGRLSAVIDWGWQSGTPRATSRSRGRCCPATHARSSARRSRSTTRPGLTRAGGRSRRPSARSPTSRTKPIPPSFAKAGAGWTRCSALAQEPLRRLLLPRVGQKLAAESRIDPGERDADGNQTETATA